MRFLIPLFICFASIHLHADEAIVIPHSEIKQFEKYGITLKGLATSSLGAKQYEVWQASWPVGGKTPLHTHETEEVFIFLKGKGKAVIGGKESHFEAPCTVICPANVPHQFFNTGDEKTFHIDILGINSTIVDADQVVMNLPWRN